MNLKCDFRNQKVKLSEKSFTKKVVTSHVRSLFSKFFPILSADHKKHILILNTFVKILFYKNFFAALYEIKQYKAPFLTFSGKTYSNLNKAILVNFI